MKKIKNKIVFLLLFVPFITLCGKSLINVDKTPNNKSEAIFIYNKLENIKFDENRVANIENLNLKIYNSDFYLKKGKIYFLEPIKGITTGFLFIGEGDFKYYPPNDIEKYQLKRFTDKDSLIEDFSEVYIRYTGNIEFDKENKIELNKHNIPKKANNIQKDIFKFFLERMSYNISPRILSDILSENQDSFFLADIKISKNGYKDPGHLVLIKDSKREEEISLDQYFEMRVNKPYYRINLFSPKESFSGSKEEIDVKEYNIDIKISENGKIDAKSKIGFISNVNNPRVINFLLDKELKVDKIYSQKENTLDFIQKKDELGFSVILNDTLKKFDKYEITIEYSGKILEKTKDGYFSIKKSNIWFPKYDFYQRSIYKITYRFPQKYTLVSSGDKIREWKENNLKCSEWEVNIPVIIASFNLGFYKKIEVKEANLPPIIIYGRVENSDKTLNEIGKKTANALRFFIENLGAYQFNKLSVTEIPQYYGQGFPNLIYLPSFTYKYKEEDYTDLYCAHEVSHQWWGHTVFWKTYHDIWLSEGFAEYSAAWFVKEGIGDDEKFRMVISAWKDDIIEKGNIGSTLGLMKYNYSWEEIHKSDAVEAGPVWLGTRLGQRFKADYDVNIYEKGAYILHMIKILMTNFNSMDDSKFKNMLHDFVDSYREKLASTEDFKSIVEKHIGYDMDWFFNQWVYGTEIPLYRFSYSKVNSKYNNFAIKGKVIQEHVPENFKMYVPITIVFENGRNKTYSILIDKKVVYFNLDGLENEPKKVIFNDFDAVLCKVKYE